MLVRLFARPFPRPAGPAASTSASGAANATALAAARAAARDPGGLFNPLLLVGPGGSGKRRLLDLVASELARQGVRAFRSPVPALTRAFVRAARRGRLDALTREVLGHGALLLDEVDRLAGKTALGRVAAGWVDAFLGARRPVAVTARAHPRRLPGFDARLAGLLDSGFAAELAGPLSRPTLERLAASAADRFRVDPLALAGRSRSRALSRARAALVAAAIESGYAPVEVARVLPHRSFGAVSHLERQSRRLLGDAAFVRQVDAVRAGAR